MKKNNKLISFVLVILVILNLTACGGGKEVKKSSNDKNNNKDVSISIMHFWNAADSTIKEIAKEFEEKTGIHVDVYNSSVATHLQDINTRAQSDDLPEIFTMWPGATVQPYIDSNVVADITGCKWEDNLLDSAKEASKYDAKTYLAPVNTTYISLVYNVEVFERLGLEPPKNYEDFEKILEILKNDNEVQVPFINGSDFLLNISSIMFTTDIYQNFPDFDEKVTNNIMAFNGPEVEALFRKLLIEWPAKDYINDETVLSTDRMGRAVLDFIDGKAGIMSMGSFDIAVFNEMNSKGIDIRMFPYPAKDNHGSSLAAAGEAFAVSGYAEGREKEAALEFLNYLMEDENNAKICETINSLSALKDVFVDVDETLKSIEEYNDQPGHGWMLWPMEVQNNLKNLGDVLTATEDDKEKVLKERLKELQDAWLNNNQ